MSRHDPFLVEMDAILKWQDFFVGHSTKINALKSGQKEKKTFQSQMKIMCGKTLIMPFNAMQINHTFTEEFIKRFDRTVYQPNFFHSFNFWRSCTCFKWKQTVASSACHIPVSYAPFPHPSNHKSWSECPSQGSQKGDFVHYEEKSVSLSLFSLS